MDDRVVPAFPFRERWPSGEFAKSLICQIQFRPLGETGKPSDCRLAARSEEVGPLFTVSSKIPIIRSTEQLCGIFTHGFILIHRQCFEASELPSLIKVVLWSRNTRTSNGSKWVLASSWMMAHAFSAGMAFL